MSDDILSALTDEDRAWLRGKISDEKYKLIAALTEEDLEWLREHGGGNA